MLPGVRAATKLRHSFKSRPTREAHAVLIKLSQSALTRVRGIRHMHELIEHVLRARLLESLKPLLPGILNGVQRVTPLNRAAQAVCARDHVERILVEYVLVGRLLPTETLSVQIKTRLDDCHARQNRPVRFSVQDVHLHAPASHARVLLEGREKIGRAEFDAGQAEALQVSRKLPGLYVRRAD